jgi:hypothetical protein
MLRLRFRACWRREGGSNRNGLLPAGRWVRTALSSVRSPHFLWDYRRSPCPALDRPSSKRVASTGHHAQRLLLFLAFLSCCRSCRRCFDGSPCESREFCEDERRQRRQWLHAKDACESVRRCWRRADGHAHRPAGKVHRRPSGHRARVEGEGRDAQGDRAAHRHVERRRKGVFRHVGRLCRFETNLRRERQMSQDHVGR